MASQSSQADLLEYIDFRSVECLNQQPAHAIGNALKQVRVIVYCNTVYTASFTQVLLTQGYRDDQGLYLESDTDEQLLIHIPFNQGTRSYIMISTAIARLLRVTGHPSLPSLLHVFQALTKHFRLLTCLLHAAVKLNSLVIKSSETEGKGPKRIRLFKNTPSIGFGEAENAPAIQEFNLTEKDLEGEALTLRSGLSTSYCLQSTAKHANFFPKTFFSPQQQAQSCTTQRLIYLSALQVC